MTIIALEQPKDMSPADWIISAAETDGWAKIAVSGPGGFSNYVRLLFVPDPSFPGQRENDVDFNRSGPSMPERRQLRSAIRVLDDHTTTPGAYYFAIWVGNADIEMPSPESIFSIPNRDYFLLYGQLDLVASRSMATFPLDPGSLPDPAFIWPSDRSWVIANDVDPHFATIGASAEAIDCLLRNGQIDTVRYGRDTDPPHYL